MSPIPGCEQCEFIKSANQKMGWTVWPCLKHRKEQEAAATAQFGRLFEGNEYKEKLEADLIEREARADFDSVYHDWDTNRHFE